MRVTNNFTNMGKCICYKGTCATYHENNLSGGLFCSTVTCQQPLQQKGCSCNNCVVWDEYCLIDLYFCAEGSEIE